MPGVSGTVTVEAPLVGVAKKDYENLFIALKKMHPNVQPGQVRRISSTIKSREDAPQFINPYPGMTLRQLFTESPTADGTGAEAFREVGTVFFEGAAQDVLLRYLQDKGMVGLTLKDRMTGNATRFSNQVNAGIPVENLSQIIQEILGSEGRELSLRVKTHPVPIKKASELPKQKRITGPVFTPPEHLPAPKAPKAPKAEKAPAPETPAAK